MKVSHAVDRRKRGNAERVLGEYPPERAQLLARLHEHCGYWPSVDWAYVSARASTLPANAPRSARGGREASTMRHVTRRAGTGPTSSGTAPAPDAVTGSADSSGRE